MDYIKLLNLQFEPFSNSPDPSFFYLSRTYQACLQDLEISIRLKRGLNLVLGDIGTGKTTLSRALIQQFQSEADRFQFYLILDPSFKSESDFLYALIMGFGIKCPSQSSLFAYKESIRQFLLDEGVKKERVIILIVDEGQKLNGVCLELLRDLLNFETNQFKLLQLIIMAQKEFHEKVKERRNLTDRINTFHTIRPLDRNETQDMIRFRLLKAGWKSNDPLFSPEAIDHIYYYSQGYPRKIITICHHSLLFMLIRKAFIVEPDMVEQAVSQIYDYEKESKEAIRFPISNIGLSRRTRWGFNHLKLIHSFSLKRLMNPALLIILICLLFLTLLWGTRNMNWSDLNMMSPSVKEPVVTSELNLQSLPVQAYENKDRSHPDLDFTDISEPRQSQEIGEDLNVLNNPGVSMVASQGDTIFKLAREVYKIYINNSILKQIRLANPHILDLNHIEVGDEIFFPPLPAFPAEELSSESFVDP